MPPVVLRMKRVVRRLARPAGEIEPSGAWNEASWQAMLTRVAAADRDIERRLAAAEQALNRLGRN